MKKRFNSIFIALTLIIGCTKEEVTPRIYPRVITIEAFNITSEGVSFKAEITFSNVEIKDHGFVWSDGIGPLVGSSNSISNGPGSGAGVFEMRVDRSLQQGKKYYLRAYAVSDDFVVYGNTIEFVSMGGKAAAVKDFFPSIGTWGDTVTIVGQNFSDELRTNVVKFGEANASVIRANKDTLFVTVPAFLTKDLTTVSVSVAGNSSHIDKQFQLKAPEIESVTPDIGLPGTKVVIKGKYLLSAAGSEVYFGETKATIWNWSVNQIETIVPDRPNGIVSLSVRTGTGNLASSASFKIQPEHLPELNTVQPTVAKIGETIKLIGNYFATEPGQNTVKFGNIPAYIISESKTEIEVIVPDTETRTPTITVTSYGSSVSIDLFALKSPTVNDFSPHRAQPGAEIIITGTDFQWTHLKVLLDGQELPIDLVDATHIYTRAPIQLTSHEATLKVLFYDQEFILNQTLTSPWIILDDFPEVNLGSASDLLVYNNTAYLIFGQTKQMWKFNGSQWSRLNDFPGTAEESTFSFIIGDKGFVGGGTIYATNSVKELWEYNFANDSWTKQSDIPLQYSARVGFAVGNEGFAIDTDYWSNYKLWKYDPTTDAWTIKSDPTSQVSGAMRDFVIGSSAYILDLSWTQYFKKYTPSSNQWTDLASLPTGINFAFSMGTVGYAGGRYSFYKYNPSTNTWSPEVSPSLYYENNFGFTLNGKIYVVNNSIYDNDVYEYDLNY